MFNTLADISSARMDSRKFSPSQEFAIPQQRVGIEIEMENARVVNRDFKSPFWEKKQDGSLRDGGLELVSLPLFGEDIHKALDDLDEIKKLGRQPVFSKRCSVHIHMEVLDMEREALIRFLLLYIALERILFKSCAPTRMDNIYCLPYYKAEGYEERLLGLFASLRDSESYDQAQYRAGHWPKYSALNMQRIIDLGTVEFRHLHGTLDKQEILTWIKLLICIKHYATVHMKEVETFPAVVSGFQAEDYLVAIFGEELADRIIYRGVDKDLLKGVRLAQDLLVQEKIIERNNLEYRKGAKLTSYHKYFKKEVKSPKTKKVRTNAPEALGDGMDRILAEMRRQAVARQEGLAQVNPAPARPDPRPLRPRRRRPE